MSWFDQQPQPGTIGVQGGNPGFLPGEPNPAQTPGAYPSVLSSPVGAGGAFGQSDPNFQGSGNYQDIDLNGPKGPDYGTSVGPDGSAWVQTIAGPRQIAPAGTYDPATGKVRQAGAPALAPAIQSTTGQQNGNYQQTYQQIMGGANDQASLLAHQQQLEAAGFHISPPNASGAISKIQTPDGQWVRVIGEGEGHPVWIPQDGGTGGTGGAVGSLGGMADGSLLTPWTEQFQAPDPTQIVNDKDYQNQLQQGLHGIQSSAASKGTLLTGGTLKSLDQYGQGLAASFGNTLYNRALGEYQLQKQNFQENQDRPYTKLSGLATLGKPQTIQPPTG